MDLVTLCFSFICTILAGGGGAHGFSHLHVGKLQDNNPVSTPFHIHQSFTALSPSTLESLKKTSNVKNTRRDSCILFSFSSSSSSSSSASQRWSSSEKRQTLTKLYPRSSRFIAGLGSSLLAKAKLRKQRSTLASSIVQEDFNSRSRPFADLTNLVSKVRNLNEVGRWRIAAFTFVSAIFTFSSQLDMILIRFWNYLQNGSDLLPRMFRHDHWEWGVAVWAFFFWIHGFWLADRAVAKADAKGIVHPWKKYRLQDQYEAEKFRRMQLRKLEHGEDVDLEAKPPVVKQHKWHLGFWIFELPLYCIPLYLWDICIPRRAAKIAAWGAPTALGVCKDVTCALLLYDLGFFVCHYLMHKVPFLYKYVHAKHHISTEVRASDIVRLSFVEEIVDVGISILALNYLRCHPISRTLYNIIITFMLTELHSGFAFPWTPQFVVPLGLATGSKGHHYHHRNGEHYYQKFFCHVDRLFGFVQKKDDTLKGFSMS